VVGDHDRFVQHGLAISLSVAALCFLLVMLMGPTDEHSTALPASQQSFSIPQSPKRISAAVEKSLTVLGWDKTLVLETATNATLEALTATGVPVKISLLGPAGRPTRISIKAAAPSPLSEQLTQQLHDALLVALR